MEYFDPKTKGPERLGKIMGDAFAAAMVLSVIVLVASSGGAEHERFWWPKTLGRKCSGFFVGLRSNENDTVLERQFLLRGLFVEIFGKFPRRSGIECHGGPSPPRRGKWRCCVS